MDYFSDKCPMTQASQGGRGAGLSTPSCGNPLPVPTKPKAAAWSGWGSVGVWRVRALTLPCPPFLPRLPFYLLSIPASSPSLPRPLPSSLSLPLFPFSLTPTPASSPFLPLSIPASSLSLLHVPIPASSHPCLFPSLPVPSACLPLPLPAPPSLAASPGSCRRTRRVPAAPGNGGTCCGG